MRFELRPDKDPNEFGLYDCYTNRRVCGVYIHPETGNTRLIWWSKDYTLPNVIETADLHAVTMLVTLVAEGAEESL